MRSTYNHVLISTLALIIVSLSSGCMETEKSGSGDSQVLCDNSCEFAFDGMCDDGGANSMYSLCDYGSDCSDCGSREATPEQSAQSTRPDVNGCSDSCVFASDGICDDGGANSTWDVCQYGTDCSDCGVRSTSSGQTSQSNNAPATGCDNTCEFAFDGECDDGGYNSLWDICAYGSDCADCGAR